jgi:endoglucanase
VSELIRVDQFGYRPEAKKVAILVDPIEGWNADQELKVASRYEVRAWDTGGLVAAGPAKAWNGGAIQKSAGDRGYWYDFTSLGTEGSYCVVDTERGVRSYRFDVSRSVYRDVLRAALKVFYFQRANVRKERPYACAGGKCWVSGADYVGAGQDREARSARNRDNPKTARDLSGGWWDAGDVNKYVTFAQAPLHLLLTAYADRPRTFTDDFGIPESGNGIPDVLDEIKVELDWFKRMQAPDLKGGVLLKVGNVAYGDPIPERSRFERFYYPEACSSSTISAAGVFAHAALVMREVPALKDYAEDLATRARSAWTYFQQHPRNADCDDGSIKSGDADRSLNDQAQSALTAAVYLFALTGEETFAKAIADGLASTRAMREEGWSSYDPDQGDALLFYARLGNAAPAIKGAIVQRKLEQARRVDIYVGAPELDLYRAYMPDSTFHWGHNMVRANVGNTNMDLVRLLPASESTGFVERAAGLLHSFHGVNALGLVYLSNMYAYGAESSVNQIYHTWFRDGDPIYDDAKKSTLGPPPGYVPGGPNASYCGDAQARCYTSSLRKQPPQKAYLDFNTAWEPKSEHDRSWEISEPAIYYQAAYIKLVSQFVD